MPHLFLPTGRVLIPNQAFLLTIKGKDVTALQCCFCPTCPSPVGGSLIPNQAFPLTIKGKDVTALQCCLFRSTPSLLSQGGVFCPTCPSPAGGSLTHSQALALSKRARDVTALRCSEPLRSKVGGASKPSPCFAGWDRLGNF